MAEGTYEYECARAELLGMREPSIDEFNAAQEARQLDSTEAVSIKYIGRVKTKFPCIFINVLIRLKQF